MNSKLSGINTIKSLSSDLCFLKLLGQGAKVFTRLQYLYSTVFTISDSRFSPHVTVIIISTPFSWSGNTHIQTKGQDRFAKLPNCVFLGGGNKPTWAWGE